MRISVGEVDLVNYGNATDCRNGISPLHLVEQLAQRYDDVPVEAIVKEDLLRRGMAWSPNLWRQPPDISPKPMSSFPLTWCRLPPWDQDESRKAPEEVHLSAGPWRFSILGMVTTTYWRTGRSPQNLFVDVLGKEQARVSGGMRTVSTFGRQL